MNIATLKQQIFRINSRKGFNRPALQLFKYQAKHNPVYRKFLHHLGCNSDDVRQVSDIPFLSVHFFKTQRVVTEGFMEKEPLIFRSSGTSRTDGMARATHYVAEAGLYRTSYLNSFRQFYGDPGKYHIVGLLPTYAGREDASLLHMVEGLCEASGRPFNGCYGFDYEKVAGVLEKIRQQGDGTLLLIGVSFALLELARRYPMDLSGAVVMETGGMKGRGKEMTRQELHMVLGEAFGVERIHSEYGMTELLSQAYAQQAGRFITPPWMQVRLRDLYDPLASTPAGQTGAINVIDLANIHSCAFLATDDLGRQHSKSSFEVLGRLDNSEVRGCNLMVG